MLLLFQTQGSSGGGDTSVAATVTLSVLTKPDGILRRGDAERFLATINPGPAPSTLFCMAKRWISDADASAIFSKTIGAGITVVTAGSSSVPAEVLIETDSIDTKSLPNRTTKLFLELTDDTHTLIQEKYWVAPEVRQA